MDKEILSRIQQENPLPDGENSTTKQDHEYYQHDSESTHDKTRDHPIKTGRIIWTDITCTSILLYISGIDTNIDNAASLVRIYFIQSF